MIDDEVGMWTSKKTIKKVLHFVLFKVCTPSFHHTKKALHETAQKKTKKKKVPHPHHKKEEDDAFARPRDIFSVLVSLLPDRRRIVGVSQADENIDEANEMLMTSSTNRRRGGGGSSSTASATSSLSSSLVKIT